MRTAAAGNVRCVSEIARCWAAVHLSRRRRHLPAVAIVRGMRLQRDSGVPQAGSHEGQWTDRENGGRAGRHETATAG